MQDVAEDTLESIEAGFQSELAAAREAGDLAALNRIRSAYFGPKGRVTLLLRGVGRLPPDQRPAAGREVNRVRQALEATLVETTTQLEVQAREQDLRRARVDLTLPGRRSRARGGIHPVNQVIAEISQLFARIGFDVATGPEVELDRFNFEALNFPAEHPARDMQATFFVRPPDERGIRDLLLRTHTSPVQVRAMRERKAPIRIIAPGRVYRCDSDATHSPMFHQVEGLWVDSGISFAHLKGVLTSFTNAFFGTRPVRFRPSFFPFVEPGAEMDIQCVMCNGGGCRLCKQTGWMEILGAGMVHPAVLEAVDIDPEKYTGFAFGLGVDRIAMLRWGIDDLAHLFRGDLRFLEQIV